MWIQHKYSEKSEKTKHGSMFFSWTNKGVEFALSSFLFIEKSIWRKKERTRTKNTTEQKGLFRCGTQWFFNIWLFYFLGSRSILKKEYIIRNPIEGSVSLFKHYLGVLREFSHFDCIIFATRSLARNFFMYVLVLNVFNTIVLCNLDMECWIGYSITKKSMQ